MSYKVAGEFFLVEKIHSKSLLGGKEEFKNVVKILAIGEKATNTSFKVGDRVLVGGCIDGPNGETYIAESQIFRWVLEE